MLYILRSRNSKKIIQCKSKKKLLFTVIKIGSFGPLEHMPEEHFNYFYLLLLQVYKVYIVFENFIKLNLTTLIWPLLHVQ